jgi:hypothetical protein
MPLSNPSFAKKDARGECIGPLDRIIPTYLDFWRSSFICMVHRGPPRPKVWDRSPRSLEGALGAKKSSLWTSHPRANLRRRRPCLEPRSSRSHVNVKDPNHAAGHVPPLGDFATRATGGAPVVSLTNETDFTEQTAKELKTIMLA